MKCKELIEFEACREKVFEAAEALRHAKYALTRVQETCKHEDTTNRGYGYEPRTSYPYRYILCNYCDVYWKEVHVGDVWQKEIVR